MLERNHPDESEKNRKPCAILAKCQGILAKSTSDARSAPNLDDIPVSILDLSDLLE